MPPPVLPQNGLDAIDYSANEDNSNEFISANSTYSEYDANSTYSEYDTIEDPTIFTETSK